MSHLHNTAYLSAHCSLPRTERTAQEEVLEELQLAQQSVYAIQPVKQYMGCMVEALCGGQQGCAKGQQKSTCRVR